MFLFFPIGSLNFFPYSQMNNSSSILLNFKNYYQTHVLHICVPTGLRINMSALQQHFPCFLFNVYHPEVFNKYMNI
jgi:hypothetical protein